MKQNLLKSLLSLLLLFVGMNAWATDLTVSVATQATGNSWENGTAYTELYNTGGVSIIGSGTGNNCKYYSTDSSWRFYSSGDGKITVTVPEGNYITAVTFTGTSYFTNYSYTSADTKTNTKEFANGNGTSKITSITVSYVSSSTVTVTAPTITPATGSYASSQTVSITGGDDAAHIYYTYGAEPADPTNASTEWTNTSSLTISDAGTTVVKAIAYDTNGNASAVTTNTIKILTPYTSLSAAHAAATTTASDCAIKFTDVLVTAVTSSNAYIMDGDGNAAIIYTKAGHGFAIGDKINGTAIGQMQKYQTYALELIGFTKTTSGLTVTSGNTVTPVEKALADVTTDDICKFIKVSNVNITTATYTENTTKVTDGTKSILLYNTFSAIGDMNFSTEAKYTITGIIPAYKTLEIAPRKAEDVVCNLIAPTISFANETVQVAYTGGEVPANALTNNGGTPTYTSSNPEVATVNSSTGVVTLVAPGLTTITATTAETSTYLAGTASYNLLYLSGDGSEEHPYNAIDLNNATGISSDAIWVKGKILGSGAKSDTGLSASYVKTNVVLGDCTIAEATKETTIPVNIYSNLQNVLDLTSDATVLNKEIKVCGTYNSSYYGRCGINGNASQKIAGLADDLSVSSVGYATYYDATAWVVPTGLTVKYVSAATDGVLTWKEYAEGATVPAKTGVVVSGAEANYPITYIGAGTAAPTNLLKGSVTAETTTGGDKYYMLSLDASSAEGSVGFYYGAADGAAFTNGARKAYLALTAAQAGSAKTFLFNDEATAINAVNTIDNVNVPVYNLAGQRVNANAKGIIVKNGKKFINK